MDPRLKNKTKWTTKVKVTEGGVMFAAQLDLRAPTRGTPTTYLLLTCPEGTVSAELNPAAVLALAEGFKEYHQDRLVQRIERAEQKLKR